MFYTYILIKVHVLLQIIDYQIQRYKILFTFIKILRMIVKPLSQAQIPEGVELILCDFQPNEPLTKTFASNYPHLQLTVEERRELWRHWIVVSIQKQLVLGIFDSDSSNKMAGLSICKDINYNLPEIEEQFTNSLTEEKCFVELEERFFQGLDLQLQNELKKQGTALDIMIVVVGKEYQGKGLSQVLIAESEKMGNQHGFKYSYCQASNFKTAKSLKRNDYNKLLEVDLHQFVVEGVKPFYNIQKEDRYSSSWIKKLI